MDDATDDVPSVPASEHAVLERQLEVARRLRATAEVAGRMAVVHQVEPLARLAAEALVEDLDFDAAEVWLAEPEGRLRLVALAGDHRNTGRLADDTVTVDSGATLVADVARGKLPVLLNDVGGPYTAASVSPVLLGDEV